MFEIVFSGGNALDAELEQRDRLGEVLQPVLAEIASARAVDELARRPREQHLPAVAGRHDPRRHVHVLADVPSAVELRLAGVHADAHPDRARRPSAALRLRDRRDRARRDGEREEERVALVVDLVRRRAREASRSTRRCSASASGTPPPRARRSSRVEPSMSVNSSVTVPEG